MKKFLLAATLFASTFMYSQSKEFTEFYSHAINIPKGEKASEPFRMPTKVVYNYGNQLYVMATVDKTNYLFELIEKIEKSTDEYGDYQLFLAENSDAAMYVLRIYSDKLLILNYEIGDSVLFFNP